MRFAGALVALASLSIVSQPAESLGLWSFKGKLSKEWRWIDNFVKDESPREKVNKYFGQNFIEPKTRDALKLVVGALNVKPIETGCSESESLKVARLFEALGINLNAAHQIRAEGIRKLAFEARQDYGSFCAERYAERLSESINDDMIEKARVKVETFGETLATAKGVEIGHKDLFSPSAEKKFKGANLINLLGRALYAAYEPRLAAYAGRLHRKIRREEYQWDELVEDMRRDCREYVSLTRGALEEASKDLVVRRSFDRIDYGNQIWISWTATIACEQLKRFDDKKLADKLAAAAANS